LGDLGADVVKIEPPAARPPVASDHSSTTSLTPTAVCHSGITIRPNAV
jgi:crotonobetainyl-CoA:carnitine CoA-transferase CaiB-like acyl-CoA transferase